MNITANLRDSVAQLLRQGSAQFILPRYQNLSEADITTKSSNTDFVTVADQEMEVFLTHALPDLLPDSWVLGEEAVFHNPALRDQVSSGLVWCVDPVDGTRNFVQQTKNFCSMISLVRDNLPLASWIYLPLDDRCYFTAAGQGCWTQEAAQEAAQGQGEWQILPAHHTQRSFPDLVGTGTTMGLDGEARKITGKNLKSLSGRRAVGCAGVEAILLVTGAHDFLFHSRITPWDHTPVALFAAEIGMYVGAVPSGAPFHADQSAPLLVAPNKEVWHVLADYIWPKTLSLS